MPQFFYPFKNLFEKFPITQERSKEMKFFTSFLNKKRNL